MRKLITAIAAAAITTAHADTGPQEPVNFVKVVGAIFTAGDGFKTLIEAWDWATQRWIKPPFKAAQLVDLRHLQVLAGGDGPPTLNDHNRGERLHQASVRREAMASGARRSSSATGETCFMFKYDGNSYFYAADMAFADPLVGYANTAGSECRRQPRRRARATAAAKPAHPTRRARQPCGRPTWSTTPARSPSAPAP